jgi:hypothetical protein
MKKIKKQNLYSEKIMKRKLLNFIIMIIKIEISFMEEVILLNLK